MSEAEFRRLMGIFEYILGCSKQELSQEHFSEMESSEMVNLGSDNWNGG